MLPVIYKIIACFGLLLACFHTLNAQSVTSKPESDSFRIIKEKCLALVNKSEYDSGLYYALQLERLAVRDNGDSSEQYACILFLIGETYRCLENVQEAYRYFKRSTSVYDALNPKLTQWEMYSLATARVGYMCILLGNVDEEKFYFEKAIKINNAFSNEANAQIYILLAELIADKGEYEKADSIYSVVTAILDTMAANGMRYYLQASVYSNKAKIYTMTGNYIKAIQYLKMSLLLSVSAKANGYDNDYSVCCLNLSEAYALNNQIDSAQKFCKEAEDSFVNVVANRKYVASDIMKEKAFLYQAQKNYGAAIETYKKFVVITDSLRNSIDNYDAVMVNFGICYSEQKNYISGDSLFESVIAKLRDSGLTYSYVMLQTKKELYKNWIKEKRYNKAADSLLQLIQLDAEAVSKNAENMPEGDRLKYQAETDNIFDLLYICMHCQKAIAQNNINDIYTAELQMKGLVLRNQISRLQALRSATDPASKKLYDTWIINQEILSKQYSLPISQRKIKTDSLEETVDGLEKKLVLNHLLPAKDEDAFPKLLQPGSAEAAIEFVRYDFRSLSESADSAFYAAFIITSKDSVPRFVYLCSEKQLAALFVKHKKPIHENQLTHKIYDDNSPYSQLLYNYVWKKLTPYLLCVKKINYSTAGLLNNISFGAIYDGNHHLVNRFIFHRFFTLRQSFAVNRKSIQELRQISIWGDIDYNNASYKTDTDQAKTKHIKSLFSSTSDALWKSSAKAISNTPMPVFNTHEARNMKKIFAGSKVVLTYFGNRNATEDDFKRQASSLSGIVHISTHGFYAPLQESNISSFYPSDFIPATSNPLFRCGLAFAGANYYWRTGASKSNRDDGILTGYEVSLLDLHNVDLITLSACETGLGDVTDNEGDLGLQRAFKMAGVHNILMSLWQVPMRQTSELLSLFYTSLLKGRSYAEALRSAELVMQKKYPPYYWAGFVLIE